MPDSDSNSSASCLIRTTFDEEIVARAVRGCRSRLDGPPSIVFAFVSSDWEEHLKDFVEIVQIEGHASQIVGCSGYGLIGVGQEDENVSGMSLFFLRTPNSEVKRVELNEEDVADADSGTPWQAITGIQSDQEDETGGWLILGNPMRMSSETWLRQWNTAYPGVPCFGGLASGGPDPEELFLFTEKGLSGAAMLGVHLRGGVKFGGIVSQGCRPIGDPYTITEVQDNVLVSVGGKKAFAMLEEAYESLDEDEQSDARGNIFAGLAISEYVEDFRRGDFLVRNIVGGDPNAGVLALGAYPRVGQTVQFQVRDRDTADEDWRHQTREAQETFGEPFGSLLFTCAGRGVRLFEEPNHDASIFEEVFGKVPVAGFFCNGEIGPVGGQNFVHGYTASSVLFLNP
ncbi:MAG: hypothetical protein HKN23_19720 [Verrucomicrobiales bacterium]|nr:hypothetical protein [Verrucomicrobiales bacterium]